MSYLRTLRTSRSLTFLDLAQLAGLPARSLAEAEYGLGTLAWSEWERLALVLGVPAGDLAPPRQPTQARSLGRLDVSGLPALIALAMAATLATSTLQGGLPTLSLPRSSPQTTAPAPTGASGVSAGLSLSPASAGAPGAAQAYLADLAARANTPAEPVAPALLRSATPREPTPPRFQLTAAGPKGNPLQPAAGQVVITQGYGVGSHALADVWGAVDLAVDGDGDGYAEPAATWYTPVVATHDGVVHVTMDSYPAGNHIWIADAASGWRSGYSHLAIVTVISGQYVRAGTVIGMVGSTGVASGPHLDYQVWNGVTNVDPTELVQ
ncbi:MAG: peptidoglycan DD-metalloendopeptidase family protein [Oscillochloris sp.]|nr:peptidoglycan DD-metalloendopeptidase family protein [Oscillochloris sp.]